MAGEVYTIDIPGSADIFRIPLPNTDDEELRRQRIARMRSHKGALPESLDWIPPLLTALDDAQDMLITGLVLAKPLLKRLPARFVPYLGWILLVNDVVNLTTLLLGLTTGGTALKRSHLDALDILNSNRLRRLNKVNDFLSRTNWLGFLLQAGQVSQSLTGYGLTLGSIMGCLSDSVWGIIRLAQGDQVQVRLPPPADPLGKASRLLIQTPHFRMNPNLLSDADHAMILSAHKVATDISMEQGDLSLVETRADELATSNVPIFAPTNQATINALHAEGFGDMTRFSNPFGPLGRTTNFKTYIQNISQTQDLYGEHMRTKYSNPEAAPKIMQMMHDEAGLDFFDYTNKTPKSTSYLLEPWEISAARALEYGVYPGDGTPAEGIYRALVTAWKMQYGMKFQGHWGWWLKRAYKLVNPTIEPFAPNIPENEPERDYKPKRRLKSISWGYHRCLFETTWGKLNFMPDDPAIETCRGRAQQQGY